MKRCDCVLKAAAGGPEHHGTTADGTTADGTTADSSVGAAQHSHHAGEHWITGGVCAAAAEPEGAGSDTVTLRLLNPCERYSTVVVLL